MIIRELRPSLTLPFHFSALTSSAMADSKSKEMSTAKKNSTDDEATYYREWKEHLADTNFDHDMIGTFTPSVLMNQKMVLHSIYIGPTFKCSALLDAPILDHLPEPYTLCRPSPANTYKIAPAGNKGMGMFATRNIPTGGLILVQVGGAA